MQETANIPASGQIAYFGPPLTHAASRVLDERGFDVAMISPDSPEAELPQGAGAFIYGLGVEHPVRASLQRQAVERDMPVLSDLAFLGHVQQGLAVDRARRTVITGSAGKAVTSALLLRLLAQGGQDAVEVDKGRGFLNALGALTEHLILRAEPSAVRDALTLGAGAAIVLNLTEERGAQVGDKAREAAIELLTTAQVAVLGTDDIGCQSLLMAVRRQSASSARDIVAVSGGATLSDGWFALERNLYAVRGGRTRRIGSYSDSGSLLGDHMGQDAAAAAAVAAHFGINDDQIIAALTSFRGLDGRFDCIGTEGRIVFVDDREASCQSSTEAAITACPDVFWIGHRHGDLSKRVKGGMRGSFFVTHPDGSGPPVDGVVTFKDAEAATEAAIRAANDLLRREPTAAPVLLYSPGAEGFSRQGELFKLRALKEMAEQGRAHA
ncbi:hypothetical protein HK107_01770 [Parvularcula sp. ZS-1/3]|uniref:Uncharacterized protein n=1 Tax=Parvularcula mediterranea TaxID=2732508 RepID=A0A7Y3W4B6_9PROT|nr:hypothetical protein [Parvularcula mediterranea]NNU15051.1 hypothetical protein [Parvularcula mediterranea]